MMPRSTTLLGLLALASAATTTLVAGDHLRQVPFSYPPFPQSSLEDEQSPFDSANNSASSSAAWRSKHALVVDDDDPARVPSIRLSHSGLYINQAHAPSTVHRPDHGNQTDFFQPQPLVVHFDTEVYQPTTAVARLGPVRLRTRNQVMLHCGSDLGGIESCEADDLADDSGKISAHRATSHLVMLDCRPTPESLKPDGRFLLNEHSCPGWARYWQYAEELRNNKEMLKSFVVSVNVETANHEQGESEHKRFWVANLHLEESRASWPLAGNARDRRPGQDDRTWHENDVNRISGAMENPLIPKSARLTSDRNFGVFVDQSGWNLGVQIRIPMSITNPRDGDDDDDEDDDDDDDDANDDLQQKLVLPPEEVFAPVGGQVVWARDYTFRKPPLFGPAAGENDEPSYCLMLRDEWSIVYQIFGLEASSVHLQEGDMVARGDVLGHAMREGLSTKPPSTEPPADHALTRPDKGTPFYPHRYRKLEVRVARPDARWTEWKSPDELGWQYFHPLHVFREGKKYRSAIPPYGSPTVLYFAKPSADPLNTPPNAFGTSNDFFTPTLTGQIEVIAGFEYFQQTPGDPADGMDPLAIYALDIAFKKKNAGDREPILGMECDLGGDSDPQGSNDKEWRNVFEHSKLPNGWTGAFDSAENDEKDGMKEGVAAVIRWRSKLFSHYLPSFSHGRWFPEKITGQFDEKEKRLYYTASRTLRGEPKLGASLDIGHIVQEEGNGAGKYRVVVRARDYWGNVGCIGSDAWLA